MCYSGGSQGGRAFMVAMGVGRANTERGNGKSVSRHALEHKVENILIQEMMKNKGLIYHKRLRKNNE